MSIEIDIVGGNAGWPIVKPLFDKVWHPDRYDGPQLPDLEWANPDLRVLVEDLDLGPVSHVGLYFRNVLWNDRKLHIGGVGGVATDPQCRRRGYATVALNAAAQAMRDREDVSFVLLFCAPAMISFYEARGWRNFEGDVFVEQPAGRIRMPEMAALIFHIKRSPPNGTIDLCGLPW